MMRPALILVLLLTTAFMMRGVASDWRQRQVVLPTEVAAKKQSTAPPEVAAPLPQVKNLQPVVPGVLPDLKEGYLFNPERTLVDEKPQPAEDENADANANPLGVDASIDEVTYVGSIITDVYSQAIILYPAVSPEPKAAPQPSSRSSRVKPPVPQASGAEEHARLEIGDMLDGYEVAEILPDKLIFSKGEETVEKLLHDPDKKRKEAPPRAAGPMVGPPRPPQGAAPPRPGGIQSTTIGGSAAPGPLPATGAAPAPGTVSHSSQPAPPLPSAVSRPNLSGSSSPPSGAPQMPVRRMVISRETAPGPNTSKVLRQPQDGGIEMPPSPGMPPTPGGE
jgi:hypothetical protein